LLPKLLVDANQDPEKKANAIRLVKCFKEVQIIRQNGMIIQKYRVTDNEQDLIVMDELWESEERNSGASSYLFVG
jgi:hypothetical protein